MFVWRPHLVEKNDGDYLYNRHQDQLIVCLSRIVLNKPGRWLVALGTNGHDYFTVNRLGLVKQISNKTVQIWKNHQSDDCENKRRLMDAVDYKQEN
ncbi:MAG: hypothetical protein Q4G02_00120 [bacterium]|nr:hypothetical protein [bacterium]